MKNQYVDLHNHLFAQIERLNDDELKGEELKTEILRGKTMAGVAAQIVNTGRLVLDAEEFKREHGLTQSPLGALAAPAEEKKIPGK